jgi:hypothetical protein
MLARAGFFATCYRGETLMHGYRTASSLTLALLAATFLSPPGLAQAAPGDALGPEFQVNTFTTDWQSIPAVAMDADGDFVVVWSDYYGQDGDQYGVFAQRFDAAGVPQGLEFQINTSTVGKQWRQAVAMDADGDFVVVWVDGVQGVVFQRYNAAGAAQGTEVQVANVQRKPAVAMDADGDFVVAWNGQDVLDVGIFAQRYDAAGVPQGSEIAVNTYTTGDQEEPAVAMDANGNFVVAWVSEAQDSSDYGIFAQRFDAAGAPQGLEFRVNTYFTGPQRRQAVAMDADGDFVVAWTSYPSDSSGRGIFAKRYDADGVAQGAEFRVADVFLDPIVAMDADGDFLVAWSGRDDTVGPYNYGVLARRYDAAGVAQGGEFVVNSFTTGTQAFPGVAMDADGDFVVAWQSDAQDGSDWGIFAQRFDGAERVEGDFDGDGNADLLWRNTATGNAFVWLMEGTERRAAGSVGVVPLAWEVAGTGDFNGDGKADILWRHTGNGSAVIWQMDGFTKAASAAIGKPPLVWVVEQLRDTDGDGSSDIFWRNTTTDGTLVWRMSGFTRTIVGSPGGAGAEWQVQ